MKRVVIIGSGGAGKSTLARKLSKLIDVEVFHLDSYMWRPGWELVSREEQASIQSELVQQKEWICDGNYGATMDIRLREADTIIFLDMPRILCLYRAVKRVVTYWKQTRPDMAPGCEERFSWEFLKWIWNYPEKKRPGLLQRLNEHALEKEIVLLCSSQEVDDFLLSINRKRETAL
ncbi:DNA topology modulation protein [Halobacillus sp. A5]|uniref:DNA topology modulation protein n=1 Tax=Halobacillus sp. A5 TaxID=2880263 RepID=UPI0020A67008|nr:DNA topology modulation protein [Halobacillus sp. A5]MCP3028520.1 DNA topology modulation protein [Halobacillus sp. A5]